MGIGLIRCYTEIKSCKAAMYALLPYLWILFMVVLFAAVVVASVMGRPKKAPKKTAVQEVEAVSDSLAESEPVLDFGDDMAQLEKK